MDKNDALQKFVDGIIETSRKRRMETSDQLTLGQLIALVENCEKSDAEVVYDFGYMAPTDIDSWRGSYAELALNYTEDQPRKTKETFLSMLKEAVGKTFTGYKGGEYRMSNDTPIWVANYGNSSDTAVIGVLDNSYQIIIETAHREY